LIRLLFGIQIGAEADLKKLIKLLLYMLELIKINRNN
jgi:hypothetical protein